jgi:ABC-type amino acid transport substrate-binding protein
VRHEVDVLLTNFTVTHERAALLAISYPWFDTGLRVMVNSDHSSTVFHELLDSGRLVSYLWLAALMLVLTVLITILRRRVDTTFTKEWKTGLASSFHDLIVAAKSGRISYAFFGWIGYILSGVWMIVGVALIAYVTSTLTTAMTTVSLHSGINSLYDLPRQSVGVVTGTVSHDLLNSLGITVRDYDALDDAVNALLNSTVGAVVADAPELEYLAFTRPELGLSVVGNLFYPEKYAFAANGSQRSLMDAISLEIIKMHERGDLKALREKYFGMLGL